MKNDKCAHENGQKTVLEFLSSKTFFVLPIVFILIPVTMILTVIQSKHITVFLNDKQSNFSTLLSFIIFTVLLVVAELIAFFIMHYLYKYAFTNSEPDQKIWNCFSFLQAFSIIIAIISILISVFTLGNIGVNGVLYYILIPNNLSQNFSISWNVKIFLFYFIMVSNFLTCFSLTRWLFAVEDTLKTNKINIKGAGFLNKMAVVNCVELLICFIVMVIEQDIFFTLFLLSLFAFNITLIFNTMRYLKLCNNALATQYDNYIAELHKEKEVEYYDPFADRTDTISQEETFSKNEPYEMDPSFQRFDFYIPPATETENDFKSDARVIGTCPVCQYPLHGESTCPKCGYIIYKNSED